MILIYTHKITPRVNYIFKHVFTRTLQIEIKITTKIEDFVAFNGLKLSYTKVALGNEFFIKSSELLFQQGINDVEINMSKWGRTPCFFATGIKSAIPFDIFSASFYLITRYEEYLPHVKDAHGRFPAKESIAFKKGFLEKPLIDVWAYKLLQVLKDCFPDYKYKQRKYTFVSTVDIDNAYAYKHKSVVRSIGGLLKDIYKLNLFNVWDRIAVLFNIKKDPFDTFNDILKYKETYKVRTIFFFLVADYTSFDTNTSVSKNKFKFLIKEMVDYARVGLHPSYYTMKNAALLKKRKNV